MADLLVVEDDETIGRALSAGLRQHGHAVSWQRTGRGAVEAAAGASAGASGRGPDLVLLDLGLPDLDGVEVCRRLRTALPDAVIVILTARAEEMDVVLGLEAGADDYLTKPFRFGELLARLRAHLRRGTAAPSGPRVLTVGSLVLDVAARRAHLAGRELVLRAKEMDLLVRLAQEPGTAVGRETLMAQVWDEHWFGSTKTLDVHVAALRRRLASALEEIGREAGPDGVGAARRAGVPVITTLRGHGYRLEVPDVPVPDRGAGPGA